jgi:hypothetical protein
MILFKIGLYSSRLRDRTDRHCGVNQDSRKMRNEVFYVALGVFGQVARRVRNKVQNASTMRRPETFIWGALMVSREGESGALVGCQLSQ